MIITNKEEMIIMTRIKNIILLVLTLSLCLAVVSANENSRFYITEISPRKFQPSQEAVIDVTITNVGGGVVSQVTGEIDVDNLPDNIQIMGETKSYLGSINPTNSKSTEVQEGNTGTLQYKIKIDDDASTGVYYVPITVNWKTLGGTEESDTLQFGIEVTGDAELRISSVSTTPSKVYPDTDFNMSVSIENVGNDKAKAVAIALEIPKEFSGETNAFLGSLEKDDSSTASFDLRASKDAKEGDAYAVTVQMRYDDERGIEYEEDTAVEVFIHERGDINMDIGGITTTPTRILSDTDFSLTISLENSGDQDAKSTEIKLKLPDGFSGESKAFLGTITADESATASFDLKASKETPSGMAYNVLMDINYKDENGALYSVEKNFDIFIHERGDIALSIAGLSTSPTTVYPGTKFTLSVQLENTGTQDAKSVKIDVSLPEEFIGERSSFVGEIEQDDVSSGILDLRLSDIGNSGSYDVNMKVRYSDEKGTEYSDDMQFVLFVDATSKDNKKNMTIMIGALLVVGIYVWKKRRVKIE